MTLQVAAARVLCAYLPPLRDVACVLTSCSEEMAVHVIQDLRRRLQRLDAELLAIVGPPSHRLEDAPEFHAEVRH